MSPPASMASSLDLFSLDPVLVFNPLLYSNLSLPCLHQHLPSRSVPLGLCHAETQGLPPSLTLIPPGSCVLPGILRVVYLGEPPSITLEQGELARVGVPGRDGAS